MPGKTPPKTSGKPVQITAQLHRGMPTARLDLDEDLTRKIVEASTKGPVSISLQSLNVDLQHNQSFGMVEASTGCISNPGGPGC